ncbi:SDR family NAD(P)-dependent oxidoreductase [Ruixingdingia sedimenti]|uniref:SDR family oxidoreductase n=1 Tax=Ruixingdingia sedimenti TaxID=3073604 RepID=A0ABU1FD83_9RHOB|nr:SDR family oxidoreductase [Xinfangfangia sp. LG-4]MDR5654856.1 SDR family oxidoreductase [Xinfangfangia sp. LG-4]
MKGKLAIVTAAASGMGRAGCVLFAEQGATVAVVDIDAARTQAVVDEITAAGGKAKGFVADLSKAEECTRVIDEAAAWLGGLDVLWAHAGTPGPSQYEGMDMGEYDFALDLNLTSAVACSAAAGPHIRKRGGGAILFTSSVGGLVGSMMSPVYSMAKFGIVGLTMSLAQRYAPDGIRVNAVCPGPVETAMLPHFFGRKGDEDKMEENRKRLMAVVPLGRTAQPVEIAHAAMWLLSDDASYVTGVALPVDGGYVCR